jgi:hypothetical protein
MQELTLSRNIRIEQDSLIIDSFTTKDLDIVSYFKDKKIEETAREELKSSMSRALEELKLPAREEKAAEKLANKPISPRVRQIARTEVFKEENPIEVFAQALGFKKRN